MKYFFAFFTLFILIFSVSADARNRWEMQSKPVPARPESVGTYSLGCLMGAEKLPLDGYGYQVMRPSRHRYYSHPEMIMYIKSLAKKVKDELNSVLIVGDVGLPQGGPFSYGHNSHQIGLDADFWYYTPPAALKRSLSGQEREKINAVSLVNKRKRQVNLKTYTNYDRKLLHTAADLPEVDRIFVNPAIKKDLCRVYKGEEWLGKIRPWSNHDDHFHVRLKCAPEDNDCHVPDNYEPIKGDGCDDTLSWWFKIPTKAEIIVWKKKLLEDKKKPKPKLPARCLELEK